MTHSFSRLAITYTSIAGGWIYNARLRYLRRWIKPLQRNYKCVCVGGGGEGGRGINFLFCL